MMSVIKLVQHLNGPQRTARNRAVLCMILALCSLATQAHAGNSDSLLAAWLGAQTNIHAWAADFIQTRMFKSLTEPLTATGHVWFAEPNRFRWELGHPPQTIAVRAPRELLVIYPRLKRVERYPLGSEQTGQWRDALALLETGFPRTQAELEARYKILSQKVADDAEEVVLEPKSAAARRMMPRIKIAFDTNDFSLRATELEFADGSAMRNDFQSGVLNPKFDEQMFTPPIPGDYEIVEPLKAKSPRK